MQTMELNAEQAGSAKRIQEAIDSLDGGGRVVLPAMELELDRALQLRSGIELVGQGEATVLRKGPGRVYPLSGYHNYGMCDVPLLAAAGLEAGMTVSVHDGRTHGGFYETFATITWVDGDWVGLDHGIEADYSAEHEPCLTTIHPLVCGHGIAGAALRDMRLEGSRAANAKAMGGCRGGAVYFAKSRDLEISGIRQRDYFGEGLSFQMCSRVTIRDCRFDDNTGNGLHPGAGSTEALFEQCGAKGNGRSGFFFCVRATRITVRDCDLSGNSSGVSIGTRDCHNLIEDCIIGDNDGVGIVVRPGPVPVEVHSCLVRGCRISGNHAQAKGPQIQIPAAAHDLVFENNEIGGVGGPGIGIETGAQRVWSQGNRFAACQPEIDVQDDVSGEERPEFSCGWGTARPEDFRHLPAL
jgi:polygalacturonase